MTNDKKIEFYIWNCKLIFVKMSVVTALKSYITRMTDETGPNMKVLLMDKQTVKRQYNVPWQILSTLFSYISYIFYIYFFT